MPEPLALDQAEELICAVIRGERVPWSEGADLQRMSERSVYHGVQQILHERLEEADGWPAELRRIFRNESIGRAMWEMRHEEILGNVIEGLAIAGIRPVLIKGSALAYTHYPNPALRTRGDTDLIVASEDMTAADRVLLSLGFSCEFGSGSTILNNHSVYSLVLADRTTHTIEVHSRLSVSQLISNLLPHSELIQRATSCRILPAAALAHGSLDAILINCLHRASHKHTPYYCDGRTYYGANRLIWLYDIHLIASRLAASEWDALVEMARSKGLASVLNEGLIAAQQCFKTTLPKATLAALAKGDREDTVARCIQASHYGKVWIDFQNLPKLGEKLRFLANVVFPPAEFIRSKHPQARLRWLPWLYIRTLAGASLKWLDRKARQLR